MEDMRDIFDVITFGSATKDIFLRLKKEEFKLKSGFISFPIGAKIFIEEINTATGGGGTNTAATFSNLGFKTAYCGKVGDDEEGEVIEKELEKFKIFKFLKKDKKHPTAISIVLSSAFFKRTILIYRGACHFLRKKDIPFGKLKAKWFYIGPLSGESAKIFPILINFAKNHNIKVMANLGNSQIALGKRVLKPILSKIDILLLNQNEASLLAKTLNSKKLFSLTKGIIIITKEKKGSLIFDGKYIFKAETLKTKVIDKTGAGDAYGSGFLAGILEKNNIEYAMKLATANASKCLTKLGAKNGLLKKGDKWQKAKVIKTVDENYS